MPTATNRAVAPLTVVVLLALLVLVALAAGNRPELISADRERVEPVDIDIPDAPPRAGSGSTLAVVVSLALGSAVIGGLLYLVLRHRLQRQAALLVGAIVVITTVLVVLLAVARSGQDPIDPVAPVEVEPDEPFGRGGPPYWLLVVIGSALVAAIALGRSKPAPPAEEQDVFEPAVTASMIDLEGIADPRKAIITAYARLEQSFAACGLERDEAKTAREFVSRVLRSGSAAEADVRRLGDLYEHARFDPAAVTEVARADAIGALGRIRASLGLAAVA